MSSVNLHNIYEECWLSPLFTGMEAQKNESRNHSGFSDSGNLSLGGKDILCVQGNDVFPAIQRRDSPILFSYRRSDQFAVMAENQILTGMPKPSSRRSENGRDGMMQTTRTLLKRSVKAFQCFLYCASLTFAAAESKHVPK
jgi:hypothetical protein